MAKKLEAFLCSECKCSVAKKAESCPHCNTSFEQEKSKDEGAGFEDVIFIAVMLLLIYIFFLKG